MKAKDGSSGLTAERLRELLHYDPATGLFTWRGVRTGRRTNSPQAGCDSGKGYIRISVDGCMHRAHRLAWLYVRGKWPVRTIDHINGDPGDNRIANLRDVSLRKNVHNAVNRRPVREGAAIGVERRVRANGVKWRVKIGNFGRQWNVGTFDSQEAAEAAYKEAKLLMHMGVLPQTSPRESGGEG